MRAVLIAAIFAGFATAAAAQSGGPSSPPAPSAKDRQPATTGMGTAADAPVGHRQPTRRDLPARVRQNEAAPAATDPLCPLPKICDGC